MAETSRLRWPYPQEFEEPWYDSFVSFAEATDASAYTTREDRSSLLMGGGTVSFAIAGVDGVLSWTQPLAVLSPLAGFLLNVMPTTVALLDGEMLYVNMVRAPIITQALPAQKARQVPNTNDAVLLAIRRGHLVYWRNGKVIANGDAFPLFEQTGSGSTPLGNGTPVAILPDALGAPGISSNASRQDHQHPITTDVPATVKAVTNTEGVFTSFSRADHQHALGMNIQSAGVLTGSQPILNFIGAGVADDGGNNRVNITVLGLTASAPTTIQPDDAPSVGISSDGARADHKHGIVTDAPVTVTAATNLEGVSTSFGRADHQHRLGMNIQLVGVLKGSRPTLNFIGPSIVDNGVDDRVDITVLGLTASSPTTIEPDDTAFVGISADAARADHRHGIVAAAPGVVTAATNAEGVSTSFARADHQHRLEMNVQQSGFPKGSRPTLNFIGATVVDDAGNDRVNITIPAVSFVQTKFAEVTVDVSTTSTGGSGLGFVTLLTVPITTSAGNSLYITAAFSASNSLPSVIVVFRVTVDGVPIRGSGITAGATPGNPESGIIQIKSVGLGAGAHTVLLEWKVGSGTGRIRPVAVPDAESASLLVEEVSV